MGLFIFLKIICNIWLNRLQLMSMRLRTKSNLKGCFSEPSFKKSVLETDLNMSMTRLTNVDQNNRGEL